MGVVKGVARIENPLIVSNCQHSNEVDLLRYSFSRLVITGGVGWILFGLERLLMSIMKARYVGPDVVRIHITT